MAGCKKVKTFCKGKIQKQVKLDEFVALDAGIGRPAAAVLGDEVVDDILRELGLQVEEVMRNGQVMTDRLGRADVAAHSRSQLHGDAFYAVSLLLEQCRGDGAVHSAAHGYENALCH